MIADSIREEGGTITAEALAEIVRVTEGYPYFLQEWGKHTCNQAQGPEINLNVVLETSRTALAAFDNNFLTGAFQSAHAPREHPYLNAMALLSACPHRSGAIAEAMGSKIERSGPLRSGLICRHGVRSSHWHDGLHGAVI